MDSAGITSATETAQQSPVARRNKLKMVVLFFLGVIALGSFVFLAFSQGVSSTHEIRISSGPTRSKENIELKRSIQAAGPIAFGVLAVTSQAILMLLGNLLLRGQRSARVQLVGWVVLLAVLFAVGVAVWWCAYRQGVRFGEQRPNYPQPVFKRY